MGKVPLSISSIFNVLNNVNGVSDVVKVSIINKSSTNYSNVFFSIQDNLSPDGDYLVTPANAVLELKYQAVDIKGKLR